MEKIREKILTITFWIVWIFLLCYFMQFHDFPNELTVLLGGVLCLAFALQQKKIRIDIGICLLTITLVSYYVIINGKNGIFYSILYIPLVIYELGNYLACTIKNEKNKNEKLFVILLTLILGYGIYGILNSYMWYAGYAVPGTRRWPDFWSGEIVPGTQHAAYFLPMMACLFPALIYFKNRKSVYLVVVLTTLFFGYTSIATRSRMSVLILAIVFAIQVFLFLRIERNRIIKPIEKLDIWKNILAFTIVFSVLLFLIRDNEILTAFIVNMGKDGGILNNVRFEAQRLAVQQLFKYPMGGYLMDLGKISQAHNVWLDIANAAGLIPFFSFVLYTIYTLREIFCLFKAEVLTTETKIIILGIYIVFFLYFAVEPALEASVHLITPWIFVNGLIHGLLVKDN